MTDYSSLAATLMQSRQTILPKRLVAPGPDAVQLDMILAAASNAPDHGQLLPWRFIVVPAVTRGLLAEQFVKALSDRDPSALPEQVEQAREKAYRAPLLMLAVVNGAHGNRAGLRLCIDQWQCFEDCWIAQIIFAGSSRPSPVLCQYWNRCVSQGSARKARPSGLCNPPQHDAGRRCRGTFF